MVKLSDDELKQLQKKSLEIAKYFTGFCRKYDIKIFLFAGSLLGAVREQGFIPWDDDMDMMILAPDFEKLMKCWDKYGDKEHYSICCTTKHYNDHHLSFSIRDNYTTFITEASESTDTNQGVAIDFDALHACPDNKLEQKIQLLLAAGRSLFKAGRLPNRQSKSVYRLSKVLLGVFRSPTAQYYIWSFLEKLATLPDKNYFDHKYLREFTMFPYITWLYPAKWFAKIKWVPFEDTEMPIPIGAKGYLKKRYGNYMELPPEKDRHPEHRIVFMDLNTPYIKYRGTKYYKKDRKVN